MCKKKRWGKKYHDRRAWKAYNRRLVLRGEYYINPVFVETWRDEIKAMNAGKVGQPYLYPLSLIEFLALFKSKGYDYRSLEGIMQGLSRHLGPFPVICYSQIRRRIRALPLAFQAHGHNLIVGADGSGLKVSNRGDWMREKWAVTRGWIKVVILGDSEGNIVDLRIGKEDLDENAAGRGMLRHNSQNIETFMGDGLYDARKNFSLLARLGVVPVIKIRANASPRARGCLARKKEVLLYKEKGYAQWAKDTGYGRRWTATEGIFSAVKRMFGESVASHKPRHMYHEARLKFWAYQRLKDADRT